jgi:hypothetical protein
MDRKTTGIIATVVAVVLCGCPGLIGLCMGAMFAVVGGIPGAEIDMFGSNDPRAAMTFGLGAMCIGLLFVIIPVVVGVLTLRNKPEPATATVVPPAAPPPPDESLPPAI